MSYEVPVNLELFEIVRISAGSVTNRSDVSDTGKYGAFHTLLLSLILCAEIVLMDVHFHRHVATRVLPKITVNPLIVARQPSNQGNYIC